MAQIVVLDDILDAAVLVKKILKRQGHTVEAFTEEEECIGFIRRNQPELAILDIKLKKLTGIDVLEEIKKVSPQTLVIMLTGYPTIETAQAAVQLGAAEYLVKPIDMHELVEKTERLLSGEPAPASIPD